PCPHTAGGRTTATPPLASSIRREVGNANACMASSCFPVAGRVVRAVLTALPQFHQGRAATGRGRPPALGQAADDPPTTGQDAAADPAHIPAAVLVDHLDGVAMRGHATLR